jgi:hypothetical protein
MELLGTCLQTLASTGVISQIISPPLSRIIFGSKGGDFSDCEARWCSLGKEKSAGKPEKNGVDVCTP